MYRKYATPLRIELQSSAYAGWWLVLTHTAGLAVLPFTTLPAWVMASLAVAGLFGLRWCWSRYVNRRQRNVVRVFTWKDDNECVIEQADCNVSHATLLPLAFVMPWLVILYYRQGRRSHSLFILPDMLSREVFRRLRVRLRTEIDRSEKCTRAC